MATNYVSEGEVLPFVNTTGNPIASGAVVVVGHTLGVALVNIAPGGVGSVAIEGVFIVPKVATAEFAQGEKLLWSAADKAFAASAKPTASGDIAGAAIAWASASNGADTCQVRLTPGNSDKKA